MPPTPSGRSVYAHCQFILVAGGHWPRRYYIEWSVQRHSIDGHLHVRMDLRVLRYRYVMGVHLMV
jgi:hypothetical protein